MVAGNASANTSANTSQVPASTLAVETLRSVLELAGEERAASMYAEASINWANVLPAEKAAQPSAIFDLLETAGLDALDPKLKSQVEATAREQRQARAEAAHRELESHLRSALSADEPTEAIIEWMAEHCEPSHEVARTLMRCVLECASPEDPPAAQAICQAITSRQTLLKKYNDTGKGQGDPGNLARQAHCLFEVQRYCHAKNWPPNLMKKVRALLRAAPPPPPARRALSRPPPVRSSSISCTTWTSSSRTRTACGARTWTTRRRASSRRSSRSTSSSCGSKPPPRTRRTSGRYLLGKERVATASLPSFGRSTRTRPEADRAAC